MSFRTPNVNEYKLDMLRHPQNLEISNQLESPINACRPTLEQLREDLQPVLYLSLLLVLHLHRRQGC